MKYLITCNPKYFDVAGAFAASKELYWKQVLRDISVGDIVYIYVALPISAIKYKCLTLEVNVTDAPVENTPYTIDGTYYAAYPRKMKLRLLEEYSDQKYTLTRLHEMGLKGTFQGQRRLNIDL